MVRRYVTVLTCAAFLTASPACIVHRTDKLPTTSLPAGQDRFHIDAVLCNSGGPLQFPDRKTTGYVLRDTLVMVYPAMTLEIPRKDIASVVTDKENRTEVTTTSGRRHAGVLVPTSDSSKVQLSADRTIVPLSQVDSVFVRRVSKGKTFVATAVGTTLLVGAAIALVNTVRHAPPETGASSCPFVYAFDGHTYMLDAEPYSGATAAGLKRTEWVGLQHVKESGGEYRLKIANELDETQYTDEVRLLVVDHRPDIAVVADEDGVVHTLSDPVTPRLASDSHGRDLRPYVGRDDWISWHTRDDDVQPELRSGVKEALVFEFPKPVAATRAKLVFNGGNTVWASRMLARFLGLHGRNLPVYYASLDTAGPTRDTVQSWALREELYRLHIRVFTKDGWVTKGSLVGGGPFVTEDRVYALDVTDVPGDTLKIQLTPPVGFWMINYLAVDYSDDLGVQVRDVTAKRAVDGRGRDIRPSLVATDNNYFVMPQTGDAADLAFPVPPRVPGLERTVLMKASGYYDIHMGALGEPRLDLLARLVTEPGFGARMAWKEYLDYRQGVADGSRR